ncbi:hypothetical protein JCM3765_002792 [Sporobolomyces pararoseus]
MDLAHDQVVTERTPLLLQPVAIPPLLPFPRDDHSSPLNHSTCSSSYSSSSSSLLNDSSDQDFESLNYSDWLKIFASIKQGHLPTTKQLLNLISYFLNSDFLKQLDLEHSSDNKWSKSSSKSRLSEKGEKFRNSLREFFISFKELIKQRNTTARGGVMNGKGKGKGKEKNSGRDGWQELIWSLRLNELEIDPPRIPSSSSFSKTTMSSSSSKRRENLLSSTILNLFTLFFTSPEIRKLLIDLIILFQDILQVTLKTEIEEERIPEEIGRGIEKVVDSIANEGVEKVTLEEEHKVGKDFPSSPPSNPTPTAAAQDPPLVNLEATEEEENGTVLSDHHQTAEELKDTFIDRFKDIISRIQSTPEYQSSVNTLLSLIRNYLKDSISSLKPTVTFEPTSNTSTSTSTPSPLSLFVPLLEPFTGGKGSLSPLTSSFNSTISHFSPSNPSSTTQTLLELSSSLDQFISKTLLEPNYLSSDQAIETLKGLLESFENLKLDQPEFWKDFKNFLQQLITLMEKVFKDEYLNRFVNSIGEVLKVSEEWIGIVGDKTIKSTLGAQGLGVFWEDVIDWFAPRMFGILKEIPIPRIEFSSPELDGALEFPTLISTSLIPLECTIKNSTSLTYLPTLGSTHQDIPPSSSSSLPTRTSWFQRTSYASKTSLDLKGIEFEILDVGYFIKLKPPNSRVLAACCCCFPQLDSLFTESGLLDLHFGSSTTSSSTGGVQQEQEQEDSERNGFSFSLDTSSLESQVEETQKLFQMLPSTKVNLKDFELKFHENDKHGWLMWFLKPFFKLAVKKSLEIEVRKLLIQQGDKLGRWSYKVREKKLEHDDADERDPTKSRNSSEIRDNTRGVWNWVKAVFETITEEEDTDAKEGEEAVEGETTTSTTAVHLNRHGVSLDLPHSLEDTSGDKPGEGGATVGIGTEGVVIPEGQASIPVPPGQERVGIVNKARQEVDEAVESGRRIVRDTLKVVGEIGEASEEWKDDLEAEREKFERDGWRSDAFDLKRTRRPA